MPTLLCTILEKASVAFLVTTRKNIKANPTSLLSNKLVIQSGFFAGQEEF